LCKKPNKTQKTPTGLGFKKTRVILNPGGDTTNLAHGYRCEECCSWIWNLATCGLVAQGYYVDGLAVQPSLLAAIAGHVHIGAFAATVGLVFEPSQQMPSMPEQSSTTEQSINQSLLITIKTQYKTL